MKITRLLVSAALVLTAIAAHSAMPTAFTYQGRLNDAAGPANGNYDFQFGMVDSAGTNSPPFVSQTLFAVPVSNGVFTATLDFGTGYFNGDARWLEIAVRVTSSGSNFTTLLPRTPLTATPYALFAGRADTANTALTTGTATNAASVPWSGLTGVPTGFADGVDNGADYTAGAGLHLAGTQFSVDFAGGGTSNSTAHSDHAHFGQSWLGASTNSGLDIRNTLASGFGLTGRQGAGSGGTLADTAGVFGDSSDGEGVVGMSPHRGVWGIATGAGSVNYGVFGQTASTLGHGVDGYASAKIGVTVGVSGVADSSSGMGVQGKNTATNGAAIGMYGRTDSSAGYAVYGQATAATGTTYGLYGRADSISGIGVEGKATATSGGAIGVQGQTDSSAGYGVYGQATADTGTTYGVLGTADSTSGRGVEGVASAPSGTTYGLYGTANSTSGRGVFGVALASTGSAIGVYGVANSTNSVGVRAESPGIALKAAGSGVIQSSAESAMFIPGTAAQFDSDISAVGAAFYKSSIGLVYIMSSRKCAAGFDFPITFPAILYGQPVTLKSVTIIYACDRGNGSLIGGTWIESMDETGINSTLVSDPTLRTSKTRTSYTLPVNVKLGSSAAFVNVHAVADFIDGEQGSVTIYGIIAKFGHQ
jgi:hypothetical protein